MSEFNFVCDKCPRTFKLEEFFEKHKKVHELKKQHRCDICGFVYGAAKGLEAHIKTHDAPAKVATPEPPYIPHFLSARGVLAQADTPMGQSPATAASRRSLSSEMTMEDPRAPSGTGNYKVYGKIFRKLQLTMS